MNRAKRLQAETAARLDALRLAILDPAFRPNCEKTNKEGHPEPSR